ncbi:MAG: hypothetical protein GY910_27885 [bacterium]|nr:hypothetical protein [Deltaproteobacteria bacterium]MCP4908815.1 hypothetical protein [bacterium]
MYVGQILENKPIDMERFDTMAVVEVAQRHLETIKEPRRRQILQNFIDHARTEASGDYEGLMATCSRKEQHYASYGSRFGAPQSYAELEVHYRGLIESNIYVIHFEAEKLVVGDDALVVEGLVHQLYPGNLIEPIYGIAVDDPDAVYLATKRTCVFFVFDEDGMGAGEHSYSDGPLTADDLVKLAPDEVPERFFKNPLTS